MIDIEEKYLSEIRRILTELVPDCEVRLFGSRIEGKAEKFSDLDIPVRMHPLLIVAEWAEDGCLVHESRLKEHI